jgi:putative transposase
MQLSDCIFLSQNPQCAYHRFGQDRDHNAAVNMLQEALRLIGLIDQVAFCIGSDEGVNSAVDLTEDQKCPWY